MLDPLQTDVVNSAIRLFATSLPFQSPRIQESVLEQIISFLALAGSQQNTLRRSAIAINIGTALFYALRVANSSRGAGLRSPESEKAMQELLHVSRGSCPKSEQTLIVIGIPCISGPVSSAPRCARSRPSL